MSGGFVDHGVEVAARLGEGGSFGSDVAVVEAPEGRAEFREELEGGVHLAACGIHRVGLDAEPGSVHGAGAEDVEAVPVERVPVADSESKVLGHGATGDRALRVIPTEGERVVAFGALVGDGGLDVGEEGHR